MDTDENTNATGSEGSVNDMPPRAENAGDRELPMQSSPEDTSNWDNIPTTAPDGRVHIKNP